MMNTKGIALLITLPVCFLSLSVAQSKKPGEALETGGERKLGVVYKTVGQRKLELDLYCPTTEQAGPCPLIVYTHGGGWAAGSRLGASRGLFGLLFKQLLQDGFCVASVDYRLFKSGGSIRMRDCVIDSKDAVRYLVKSSETLAIDPERIFVFGDSAGGHIAQMLLLSPPKTLTGDPDLAEVDFKIKAGLSWYGPSDFQDVSLFNHNDRPDFRDRFGPRITGEDSVTPEEKLRLYQEMSPVIYLQKDSPPLFMIQGDQDTTIPVKHAKHMKEKAEELGSPVEVLIVKNAGHNWRKVDADIEPSKEKIIEASVEFLSRQLELAENPK